MALPRADGLLPRWAQQCLGARHRLFGVIHPERHGADGWAVELEMFGGGTVLLAVQDQVDPALAEQIDGFGTMPAGVMKPQAAQGFRQPAAGLFIDGEFQELHAIETGDCRQCGRAGIGFDQQQGTQPVARHQPGGSGHEIRR